MQQRQLRLGDILDDYCPRERRLTNHAVVAMVGPDVKQTRCTTCDAEHEYKHAKVPRQRRKSEAPAVLYTQVASGAPKRVAHETEEVEETPGDATATPQTEQAVDAQDVHVDERSADDHQPADDEPEVEEGPVHRPLIRATLPRPEGTPPPVRPAPEFTIRQPGGRPNRFRRPPARGGQQFQGGRSNGNVSGGSMRSGGPHRPGGRTPQGLPKRHGPGGKRSK